ncbi:MFS transporter [Rathayibacter sp. Leaf296]|uniref:MFS transporter n=1 Tax=Rathayibacter sp. Leaf296 TaxID=1736327 RepID=UPI0007039E4A|nr:MFS transporter [Rathayibacter sp. Leaf296]KQQ08755.1 hypothetical protein ASF46_16025 [Rathayibacter sp. Leaf296]
MTSPTSTASTSTRSAGPFPWIPVLILGFAWFLAVSIELSPAGLLIGIAQDFGVGLAAAGTLTTFYALGNALLVLPLTALALRFARRPVLMVVMGALGLSTAVVALTPDLAVAGAGRFIGGACYALICTLFPAIVLRIAGPGHARRALTVVFTATTLGTALGAPIASLVGAVTGWRPVFLGAAPSSSPSREPSCGSSCPASGRTGRSPRACSARRACPECCGSPSAGHW